VSRFIDQGCCSGPTPPRPELPRRPGKWVAWDRWLADNEPNLSDDFGSVWWEATDTPPLPVSSLRSEYSHDSEDAHEYSKERGVVEQPDQCRYCGAELQHKTKGRTRRVCPAPECVRQRDNDRLRRHRARKHPSEPSRRYSGGSVPGADYKRAEAGLKRSKNPVQTRWRCAPKLTTDTGVAITGQHSWRIG